VFFGDEISACGKLRKICITC